MRVLALEKWSLLVSCAGLRRPELPLGTRLDEDTGSYSNNKAEERLGNQQRLLYEKNGRVVLLGS